LSRLMLTTLLILVIALFAPLLFLPGADDAHQPPLPAETAAPEPVLGRLDSDTPITVLGEDGVFDTTMAEHIVGSIAAEMPALFETEALKAQAVALRSYILRACAAGNPRHPQADVCVSSQCCKAWCSMDELREKWGEDFEENLRRVSSAAAETDGQYLSYEGEVIQAVFHASSAGKTEDSGGVWSAVPYLTSVESPETDETVKNLTTTVKLSPYELRKAITEQRGDMVFYGAEDTWLGDTVHTESGRVAEMEICGEAFSGAQLRQALSLRSTDFEAVYDGENFVFTVHGYGHGVGMSQHGANLLAEEGYSYGEILAHYYTGTELVLP